MVYLLGGRMVLHHAAVQPPLPEGALALSRTTPIHYRWTGDALHFIEFGTGRIRTKLRRAGRPELRALFLPRRVPCLIDVYSKTHIEIHLDMA